MSPPRVSNELDSAETGSNGTVNAGMEQGGKGCASCSTDVDTTGGHRYGKFPEDAIVASQPFSSIRSIPDYAQTQHMEATCDLRRDTNRTGFSLNMRGFEPATRKGAARITSFGGGRSKPLSHFSTPHYQNHFIPLLEMIGSNHKQSP